MIVPPPPETDAEVIGKARRAINRSEIVKRLRAQLTEAETHAARALEEHGGDPVGILPMWSTGR